LAALSHFTEKGMAKKKISSLRPKLTEAEEDLLSQMKQGYQLETALLGGNLVLRRMKDNEVVRPLSANRATIKALQERGLITPGKSPDPLTIVWHKKTPKEK
jgi:hypothetical protein